VALSRLQQQLDRLEQYLESCPEHQRNEAQIDLYCRQIMALEEHEQTLQREEQEFVVFGFFCLGFMGFLFPPPPPRKNGLNLTNI
jgi:hypothetical protein